MSRWTIAGLALTAALAAASLSALAQRDDGPILMPKKLPPKPVATATLLVGCDLACDWKVDGEFKGRIGAGGAAKAAVKPGQHLVAAASADGTDRVQQVAEVKVGEQTAVSIKLQPVRDARLKDEQQSRDKAADREAKDKAARELQERERVVHEVAQHVKPEPFFGYKDLGTGRIVRVDDSSLTKVVRAFVRVMLKSRMQAKDTDTNEYHPNQILRLSSDIAMESTAHCQYQAKVVTLTYWFEDLAPVKLQSSVSPATFVAKGEECITTDVEDAERKATAKAVNNLKIGN
jgi:hypothetical protein